MHVSESWLMIRLLLSFVDIPGIDLTRNPHRELTILNLLELLSGLDPSLRD